MRTSVWVVVALCVAIFAILFLNDGDVLSFWDGLAVGVLGMGILDWVIRRLAAPQTARG